MKDIEKDVPRSADRNDARQVHPKTWRRAGALQKLYLNFYQKKYKSDCGHIVIMSAVNKSTKHKLHVMIYYTAYWSQWQDRQLLPPLIRVATGGYL